MDIKEIYYSKHNLDFNLNNIDVEVHKLTGKHIKNYKNTDKTFNQMALLVFEKTPSQERNLSTLNTKLNDKCIKYFVTKINNKGNVITDQVRSSDNSRDSNLAKMNIKQKHQEMVNSRSVIDINQSQGNSSGIQNNAVQSDNFNLLPFTLSDDFNETINNYNRPIYNNISSLEKNESVNPMSLLEKTQQERTQNIVDYQKSRQAETPKQYQQTYNDNYLSERATDNIIADNKIKNTAADPKELFETGFNINNDIIDRATQSQIGINTVENKLSTTELLRGILALEKKNRPEYIEKVHYVSVNSGDRNWSSFPDTENRYDFKVVFNNGDNTNHAGIQHLYKNVNSVEVVSAILPNDSQIVPFDSRIYLNVKQYPYLLLQIDELDNVFHGTNSNNEKSFSHLLFDKEFNSSVLSSDYISTQANTNSITDVNEPFSNKFKKGFFKFLPAYFEKKMFYNNPKATLNSMSIRLKDPNGNFINTEPDVLKIYFIEAENVSDLELDATTCFPNTNCSSNYKKYLKISTIKHFSNKQFRIGDTIKIKGFSSTGGIADYINRDEGHVILNLEAENNSANTALNKSFISNVYIAQKGVLDPTTKALDTTTESSTLGSSIDYNNAYLMNQSLQTNFLFKVVTRDSDSTNVINSFNV